MKRRKLIIAALVAAFFLAILILIPVAVVSTFLGERHYQFQYESPNAEQISLTTDDGLNLAAWRVFAESPRGTVIILSGLQMPSVTAFFGYADWLAQNGWDSLLIEKRARSLSEGESIGFGMTEWLDVKAGVELLDSDARAGDLPIVAMGTSAGGATVIIAGGQIPRIDGVIAISAYSNFVDLYVDGMNMMGIPRFLGVATIPFLHLRLGLSFGFGSLRLTPVNGITELGERPILLMHSTEDWQVPFSHFERLYAIANDTDLDVDAFVRDGDWHFVVYDQYFYTPAQDIEFASVILGFLSNIN